MIGPPPGGETIGRRPRILFVAEAVTLAHVARPLALAGGLDPGSFEVIFASDARFGEPWRGRGFAERKLRTIPTEAFLGALAASRPIYDAPTLRGYLRDDLALLEDVKPDVVVGDFRLTLSISARLAGVPYLAIANAYWSPFTNPGYPMPEFRLSRLLGVRLATPLFRLAQPAAFALHARPLERLREEHGITRLGHDLRRTYTEADRTLYADVPELVPTRDLPPSHVYLGPVEWSPSIEPPSWWREIAEDASVVYATLGSSGRSSLLRNVLSALADGPLTVVVASAGKTFSGSLPSNVRVAPYLPGREIASRSSVVICNGGSPTTHQALGSGTPVLGVAENLDQHLNMRGIVQRGAGLLVRSEHARPAEIRAAVQRILVEPSFRLAAGEVARIFRRYDCHGRFRVVLDEVLGIQRSRGLLRT